MYSPGLCCLSEVNQSNVSEAFKSTSRHFDNLLNIDIVYFEQTVDRIYLKNQLNSADDHLHLSTNDSRLFELAHKKKNLQFVVLQMRMRSLL